MKKTTPDPLSLILVSGLAVLIGAGMVSGAEDPVYVLIGVLLLVGAGVVLQASLIAQGVRWGLRVARADDEAQDRMTAFLTREDPEVDR